MTTLLQTLLTTTLPAETDPILQAYIAQVVPAMEREFGGISAQGGSRRLHEHQLRQQLNASQVKDPEAIARIQEQPNAIVAAPTKTSVSIVSTAYSSPGTSLKPSSGSTTRKNGFFVSVRLSMTTTNTVMPMERVRPKLMKLPIFSISVAIWGQNSSSRSSGPIGNPLGWLWPFLPKIPSLNVQLILICGSGKSMETSTSIHDGYGNCGICQPLATLPFT